MSKSKPKLTTYFVESMHEEESQIFWDHIVARDKKDAERKWARIRTYATLHMIMPLDEWTKELRQMAIRNERELENQAKTMEEWNELVRGECGPTAADMRDYVLYSLPDKEKNVV